MKNLLTAIFILAVLPTFAQTATPTTFEIDSCYENMAVSSSVVADFDSCAMMPAYMSGDTSYFLSNQHSGQSMSPESCLSQVQVVPPVICSGKTAQMTASLVNGNDATYSWSTGETTKVITVAPQFTSTYTVTVTEIGTGCSSTVTPIVFVSGIAPQLSFTTTPASCGTTGSIDLAITDNNSNFTYSWTSGLPGQQDQSGLAAGTYSVTVTDSEGCTNSGSTTVNNGGGNLNLSATTTSPTCFGGTNGSINLTVAGGSGNYTYAWSNGSTMEDPSGLAAGTYTVTVTSGACTGTTQVTITQPNPPMLLVSVSPMQICTGQTATLTITNGCGTNVMPVSPCTTTVYPVTFTDNNGCTATASTTLTVVQCGTPPSLSVTSTTPTCANSTSGAIDLSVSGGVTPYTYLWSNGATVQDPSNLAAGNYTVTVTGGNGMTSTISATVGLNALPTANFSFVVNGLTVNFTNTSTNATTFNWALGDGLFSNDVNPSKTYSAPGTYTVILVANGPCGQSTTTQTVTVANPPCNIAVTTTKTDASCFGCSDGSASANISGGAWPYGYQWSTGANSQTINNLTAGTYTVTVSDANNCTASSSTTVGQPACVQPTALFGISSPTGYIAHCANISTGSNPKTYHWWWGDGSETGNEQNPTHTYAATGMYLVTLKVTNACGESTQTHNVLISGTPTPVTEPGDDQNGLTIFPNPAVDFVTAKFENFEKADNVYLFNSIGQQVASFGQTKSGEQINVEDFEAGTYYLCFKFGNKVTTQKFIKASSN